MSGMFLLRQKLSSASRQYERTWATPMTDTTKAADSGQKGRQQMAKVHTSDSGRRYVDIDEVIKNRLTTRAADSAGNSIHVHGPQCGEGTVCESEYDHELCPVCKYHWGLDIRPGDEHSVHCPENPRNFHLLRIQPPAPIAVESQLFELAKAALRHTQIMRETIDPPIVGLLCKVLEQFDEQVKTELSDYFASLPPALIATRDQPLRDTLEFLKSAVSQLGFEDGASLTIGHLQAQLGMIRPFSEVRKTIGRRPQSPQGELKED